MRRITYITLVLCVLLSLMLTATVSAAPARADRGAWAPNVSYAVNDTVTYGGCSYKVLQAHTSLTGWEPPTTPALFQQLSCGGPTATFTRTNTPAGPTATFTRTNTPAGPTATFTRTNTPGAATNTPTRTNTPVGPTATFTPTTGTGGCAPAWSASAIYVNGNLANDAGHNYKANWWNQNDRPSTSTTGAWTDQGACPTGPTATPSRTPTTGPSPTNLPPGSVNYNAAPYVMPLENTPPDIAAVMSASGVKAFTIAFILANGSSCSPAWDGTDPIATDTVVQAYINTIRANGGDVVPSVGGYGGTKLGMVCGSGAATYNAYQQVVTKYNLKAIDFDIEEPEIENAAAVANELYAAKQFVAQGLNVSVTMPVTTTGLNYFAMCSPNNTGAVLSWAQANSFTPTSWNIMPFDGGFGSPMGTSTINVAEIFHGQLKTCFGWDDATAYAHSGLSLMNGRSDTGEYTYQSDFTTIINYAKSHGLKRLTYWSVNRDRSCVPIYGSTDPGTKGDCSSVTQNPWDFTKLFGGF
jgi:chitinase